MFGILHASIGYCSSAITGNVEEIAADFLKTDIDVFIGGGCKHFMPRANDKNLIDELKAKKLSDLRSPSKK